MVNYQKERTKAKLMKRLEFILMNKDFDKAFSQLRLFQLLRIIKIEV